MKSSSHVSYYLYLNCRELTNLLEKHVAEREYFKLKVSQYPTWFKEKGIVDYWFDTYRIVSNEYLDKVLRLEDIHLASNGIWSDTVIMCKHILTVTYYFINNRSICKIIKVISFERFWKNGI